MEALSISSEPIPLTPNACSATAVPAKRPAIVRPEIARIGAEALRSTWWRTIVALGRPRLRAVSTCSECSSALTAARVICAT